MEKKPFSTPLILSAKNGNLKDVQKFYGTIGKQSSKKDELYFALYFAAFNARDEVVQFLLSNGVDPNYSVKEYLTPLHAAAFRGFEETVKILLNHGANVDPKIKGASKSKKVDTDYFCSPLLGAVAKNHEKVVDLLIRRGADVNVKMRKKTDKIEDELENALVYGSFKFDSYSNNPLGYSPIHYAVKQKNNNLIKVLLDAGANVNAKTDKDKTPLAIACGKKEPALIKSLLEAGADMKVEVDKGKSLLHYILDSTFENSLGNGYEGYNKAEDIESNEIFKLMLKLGADPNSWSSGTKETVLHYAAGGGFVNAVHLLLKYGANVNVLDEKKKTPLHDAVNRLKELLDTIQRDYCDDDSSSDDDDYDDDFFGSGSDSDISDEDEREERREERREKRRDENRERRYRERKERYKNRKIYTLNTAKYAYMKYHYKHCLEHGDEGFTVYHEPDVFKAIAQLLTRELARLELSGTKNIKESVELLQTPFVKPYYNKCKTELRKMKNTPIIDGISYYDFLMANESKLKGYMKNKKLKEAIDQEECKTQFPLYSRFLALNVKRGLKSLKRKRSNVEEETESDGSSDEDEVHGSVQMKCRPKRRRGGRGDGCILS